MSSAKRTQWRTLLFFSTLVGIVGRAPDTHAASFVLANPSGEQPVAEGYFGLSTGAANGEVAFDVAPAPIPIPAAPVPVQPAEVPMEILPAAMEDPPQGAGTEGDSGDQPDEECEEVNDEDLDEGAAAGGDEKPEMSFGPPEWFVDAPTANTTTTAADPYITSTTTVPSSAQYSPVLFWTITTSTQTQASPVLKIPFQPPVGDVASAPADASDVSIGEAEKTAAPEEIVAMASPSGGSVIGISIVGGALAILLVILILVLYWGTSCLCCRKFRRRGSDDDMDCDEDMTEKYTVPDQMRGKMEEDNGLWLNEWRKRKEELLNMREPPEVHVSNAVPMSPPLDLEHGREPEKFYNCPL